MERASQRALTAVVDRFRPEVVSAWQVGALSLGLLTTIAERGIPIVYGISDDWLSYGPELDAWSRAFRRPPAPVARVAGTPLGLPPVVRDLGSQGPCCFISEVTPQRTPQYSPRQQYDRGAGYTAAARTRFPPQPTPPQ